MLFPMRLLLFIFAFSFSVINGLAQKKLTLSQCLTIGIERNLSLKTHKGNIEKGKYDSDYTLIVAGDVNGDSVCDVLDASQVASAFTGLTTLSGVYKTAADINSNDKIDAGDYQSIVNRALQ